MKECALGSRKFLLTFLRLSYAEQSEGSEGKVNLCFISGFSGCF